MSKQPAPTNDAELAIRLAKPLRGRLLKVKQGKTFGRIIIKNVPAPLRARVAFLVNKERPRPWSSGTIYRWLREASHQPKQMKIEPISGSEPVASI